jgi:hypothetical protein
MQREKGRDQNLTASFRENTQWTKTSN